MQTNWYGKRYPLIRDLEALAESMGAAIGYGPVPAAFLPAEDGGPIIFLPESASGLERVWLLAHEIGHLLKHAGQTSLMKGKQEFRADVWAVCALIPLERIQAHLNASEDSMIAALSAHYEDIPLTDCPTRRLAGKIAKIRLNALSLEVA